MRCRAPLRPCACGVCERRVSKEANKGEIFVADRYHQGYHLDVDAKRRFFYVGVARNAID